MDSSEWTLKISGKNAPIPEVFWYLNGEEIADTNRYRLVDIGNRHWFEIFDTETGDSGEIVCLIVDRGATQTSSCTLQVSGGIS